MTEAEWQIIGKWFLLIPRSSVEPIPGITLTRKTNTHDFQSDILKKVKNCGKKSDPYTLNKQHFFGHISFFRAICFAPFNEFVGAWFSLE